MCSLLLTYMIPLFQFSCETSRQADRQQQRSSSNTHKNITIFPASSCVFLCCMVSCSYFFFHHISNSLSISVPFRVHLPVPFPFHWHATVLSWSDKMYATWACFSSNNNQHYCVLEHAYDFWQLDMYQFSISINFSGIVDIRDSVDSQMEINCDVFESVFLCSSPSPHFSYFLVTCFSKKTHFRRYKLVINCIHF